MKKLISLILSTIMLLGGANVMSAQAATEEPVTITADKTAQWTAQEKAAGYDLRIHGYKDWETGAYMGFTLPANFTTDYLVSATLKLYTKSATTAGKAYLYTADYDDFENGTQYQGADEKPAYNETQIMWIDELPKSGAGEIDITDYIKGIADDTANIAFRIDGKSYNNVCRQWIIGSCTNDTQAPQLVLTYSDGSGSVRNYKFKSGTENWTTSGTVTANTTDNYLTLSGTSSISQTVTEIANGKYDLHARVKNDNMGNIAYVYAKAKGHPIMKTSASVTTYINDGDWRDIYVRGVNIDEGECEVGLVLGQLSANEIMIDSRVTNEPMPDGQGTIQIDSIELTDGTNSNDVFLTGGDINWLNFMEDMDDPVRYYDYDGTEKDAIQIMAENGANIVRLRLYNDPGKGHGDGSDYLPDGYQNPEDILDLAKRVKDKGMQIQLTFHYSDYWSNAETQLIPHEWAEEVAKLGADATDDEKDAVVEQCLYDFTKDFMQKMHDQGTDPEYVSFGNEMHTGLLFDKGRATYDYGSTYRWSRLASLLKTASRATKEVSPDTKVILHLDGAGNWNKYNTFFTNCKTNEVPYDVIGISYYPYWYPDYDVTSLVSFCNRLIDTFDKDIMFMETGYSFADKTTIGGQDTRFTNVGPYQNTFGQSNMGQKAFMEELYSGFKQIKDGRCLGDLYWDPIMIQHEGLGWAYRESDDTVRENKNIAITLFDTTGHKLPAQSTFKDNGYITDTVTISGKITGVETGKTAKLTVDNKEYTVTPDRFGGYVLRIPYEDEVNVTASGSENSYDIDMKMLSVAQGIDFTIASAEEPDNPDEPLVSDYPYEIKDVSLVSESGAALDNAPSNQSFIVDITLKKTAQRDEKDYLFVAVYDTNNALLSLDYVKAKFADNGEYNFGFHVPAQNKEIGSIKAYVWNSFGSMEPLAEAVELNFNKV